MKFQDVHRGHRMPLVLAIRALFASPFSSLFLSLSRLLSLQASFLFTEDNAMLLLSDWFRDCTFVIHGTMLIQLHRFIGDKLRDGFHIPKYRAKKSEISLDRSIKSYTLFDNG